MPMTSAYDRFCAWAYARARTHIAPAVRNSQYAYRDALRQALSGQGRWLDVGCGHDMLPEWMASEDRDLNLTAWTATGIDLDFDSIKRHRRLRWRLVGNIERLPFRANSFDLVTANMVIEHVADPIALFTELGRVLTPNGRLIVHTPNASGYTTRLTRLIPESLVRPLAGMLLRRHAEDVYPTFYRANTRQDLAAAAAAGGLDVLSFDFVDSSPQLVRIPPAMAVELAAMRVMTNSSLARFRACILATFGKSHRIPDRL
jgi:2-polyprenyl-3-methyl-5-hydroxy-6-metoxy-1,4-benzoquinol methylase